MNHFSTRSIALYILAIGSAVGFFQIVTAYGEANIKAPIAVTGDYLISAPSLAGCLQQKQLLLRLQQSGIYLNASLASDRSDLTSRPTLSGRLSASKLDLSGNVPLTICSLPSQLRLTGSIANRTGTNPQVQGQLWLTSPDRPPTPVDFSANVQRPTSQSTDRVH
jgi:hypothetical protein